MGLKSKDDGAPAPNQTTKSTAPGSDVSKRPEPPRPRINEEVEKRLNPYIDANKDTYERYLKTAQEDPVRAARSLMLKDLDSLEREATLNKKQIAGAKEWLQKQPAEVQEFIHKQLESLTHGAQKDMRMLQLVLNRMRFENSRMLGASPTGPAQKTGAGMKVA